MDEKQSQALEALLYVASQKLGVSPDALKSSVESGNLDALAGNEASPEVDKLRSVMQDPEKAAEMLSSPQAKLLMALLNKGKK
ncbi:MAG TPA: hypothetical protein VJX95_00290 [Oscillospiraceae bacterium]|nr:hypothetical protein [Oscillospiraceae bacterium]